MSAGVATVGDNCIDRYLPPIGHSTVGGNALNVAVQLARLGLVAGYFGAVGDDEAGQRTLRVIRDNHVVPHVIVRRGHDTAWTDIGRTPDGDRIIGAEEFGACKGYSPSRSEIEVLCGMRHVHVGWLDDDGRCRRALGEAGVLVSQDISVNPQLDGVAIAFASCGGPLDQAITMLDRLLGQGARIAVVTRGSSGSIARDGQDTVLLDALPVTVVDTLGAGDSFAAGFIHAHLEQRALRECLDAGRRLAARTCTHWGGFPQAPEPFGA
jgi:fructoselysine 6-kinase